MAALPAPDSVMEEVQVSILETNPVAISRGSDGTCQRKMLLSHSQFSLERNARDPWLSGAQEERSVIKNSGIRLHHDHQDWI